MGNSFANPDAETVAAVNAELAALDAPARVQWAIDHLPATHVLSSSFGVQSAVMLHLATRVKPDIPVVLIDTGYLFPETYRFVDELCTRLDLNLIVAHPGLSPGWFEARHGKLWEQGVAGLDTYNRLAKVEPLQYALSDLCTGTWLSGLRRAQSASRVAVPVASYSHGRWKLHPIADWSNRDVGMYLKRHGLPRHPLWERGYVSVGDIHTTQPLQPGMREEDTRFFGWKRECGIHLDV